MPDSGWSLLRGVDHQRYEDAHQRGRVPDPDFKRQSHTEQVSEDERMRTTFTIDVWDDVDMDGTGARVYEFCSDCDGHFHQVEGDVPIADQDHVLSSRWGDRRGMKYNPPVRVTGVRIQRMQIARVRIAPPNPLILDLPERTTIYWRIRDIDHYLDGLIWEEWQTLPCAPGGGYYVGLQRATDLLFAAAAVAFKDSPTAPRMVVNDFSDVLIDACRLKHPSFELVRDRSAWEVRVSDSGKRVELTKPVRIEMKDGRLLRLRT